MKKYELENKVLQLEIELNNIKNELFKEEKVELGTVDVGGLISLCNHQWKVVAKNEDCVVVLCNDFIAKDIKFGDSVDYSESNVKDICDDFGERIENEVGSCNVFYMDIDSTSVCGIDEIGLKGQVKCRPMTFEEFREIGDLVINEDLDDWYWLLSPWGTKKRGYKNSIAVVSPSGNINRSNCDDHCGVRPICILKSNIFVSKGE